MRNIRLLYSVLILLFTVSACTSTVSEPPAPTYHVHKVTAAGETLAAISAWYTGDPKNWKVIAEANPTIKPNKLRIGDKLNIPHHLIKKRSLLNKKSVPAPTKKPVKKVSQPEAQPSPTPGSESTAAIQPEPTITTTAAPTETVVPLAPPTLVPTSTPAVRAPVIAVTPMSSPDPQETFPAASSTDKTRDDLIDEILNK